MKSDFQRRLDELFGDSVDRQGLAEADLAIDIATQFAALRERRGFTQKQLAERLGKTQQAVSKIENPPHKGHNLARLKEAVAALDATLDVTIVPLEDVEAYQALHPPKPVLEDLSSRKVVPSGLQPQRPMRRHRTLRPSPVSQRWPSPHGVPRSGDTFARGLVPPGAIARKVAPRKEPIRHV
jgi:transcriptional regulator with XRE-family HTH domain